MPLNFKRATTPNGCLSPVFLPLAMLMGFFLVRSTSVPLSDFAGYYFGGKELLAGRGGNAYDLARLNGVILSAGYRNVFVSYAPFPPFTSIVFAPFLLFPLLKAKLLFNVFSCLLFLATLMRARSRFDIPGWIIAGLPLIFFVPLVNTLFFGQAYLLLTVLLLEGFMAYQRGKVAWAALLWGVAIVCKVFPGVLVIWLVLRKDYKQALWLCAACALLLSVSIGLNGWAVWKYYMTEIFPKVSNGELNNSFTYLFQSLCMLLKQLFVYDALVNPTPLTNSPWLFGVLLGLYKAMILTVCIQYTLYHRERAFDSFSVWMTGTILISPNGSSYSLVLLVIPLIMLGRDATRRVTAIILLFLICNIPVDRLEHFPVWAQFPRLYLLLVFFGLLIRPLRAVWHWGVFAGAAVFLIGLFFAGYPRHVDRSSYFFTTEEHIFINDYSVSNGMLVYSYWDGMGAHPASTEVAVTKSELLEVRDKQIYYRGEPVTQSPDVKMKPMLINGTTILYLSDKNRGSGFYTLRKLELAGGR